VLSCEECLITASEQRIVGPVLVQPYRQTIAEDTNDNGDVIASSPGPRPAIMQSRCRPAVPLDNAADHLKRAAGAADAMLAREDKLPAATQAQINASLATIDELLLDPAGLPGRPWYKNLVYAPGRLTGYGAKTLPGVREAIEDRRFDDANLYAGRTAKVLENYADRLDQARSVVEGH